jgi:hypothetical protein
MDKKTYSGKLMVKADGQPGEFEAVFATLNVKDHDGDVTLPGAFSSQPVIIEPWNHNYQAVPVGRGAIEERGDEAVVAGKFFLNTPSGLEHYEVVKELRDFQEWSYSFFIQEAEFGKLDGEDVRFLKKMDVIGVGPVTRGAGVDTRVTDIKGKNSNGGEGEAGDGKPSGIGVGVVGAEIDLIAMEE